MRAVRLSRAVGPHVGRFHGVSRALISGKSGQNTDKNASETPEKLVPNAINGAPDPDFWFCGAETGPYRSTLETKNRGLVGHFVAISYSRPVLTVSDIELILKKNSKTLINGIRDLAPRDNPQF